MTHKPIHLHTNRLNRGVNVLLLLIPSIIFIIVLAILLFSRNSDIKEIASINEPSVLGEEAESESIRNKLLK